MLHQAVNCLNCLLGWEVVAEGNFLPRLRFGRTPGGFKVHRHDLQHWLETTGLPSLAKVISDPGMKHLQDGSPLHCSTSQFSMGVIVKIPVVPKRKLLFREGKLLVPFDGSKFFFQLLYPCSCLPPGIYSCDILPLVI